MKTWIIGTLALLLLGGTLVAALAQDQTPGWTFLGDDEHSGVMPADLTAPLILQWRNATALSGYSVSTPAVDAKRVYFITPKTAVAGTGPTGARPGVPGGGVRPGGPGGLGPGQAAAAAGTTTIVLGPPSTLHAVDRLSGAEVWHTDMAAQVSSSLAVYNGLLLFGCDDGLLYGVDAATGNVTLKVLTQGAIKSPPLVVDDVAYFGSDDYRLYAYNVQTQQLEWQFETSAPVEATPVMWHNMILFGSQDGFAYALRRDNGSLVWRQPLSGRDVYSSPMISRDKVVIAAGWTVQALDAELGERRWAFTASDMITGTPAVLDQMVFVASRDGVIYGVNDLNGRAMWRYPAVDVGPPLSSAPIVSGGLVFVRRGERDVIALTPDEGKLVWEYLLPPSSLNDQTAAAQTTQATPGQGFRPGGAPGGGPGGQVGGQQPAVQTYVYEDIIRAGVIASGADLFMLGDDGALYRFSAQGADALKPDVAQALMQIQVELTPYAYSLRPVPADAMIAPPTKDEVLQMPGTPPINLAVTIYDAGCGLNPDSLQMVLDGTPVPADDMVYQPDAGLLWWLYQPSGVTALSLPDGMHNMDIKAADWLGNTNDLRVYFYVDNALAAAVIPGQTQQGAGPGGPPGFPGGPGGPGGPPGFPGAPGGPPPGFQGGPPPGFQAGPPPPPA